MKFLMLVVADPDNGGAEAPPITIEQWGAEVDRRGVWREGDRLRPPEQAKTVRRRGGAVMVSDGPFTETHEWIGGFDVLECADIEEALELAALHPMATHGAIEVRPVWPLS
jgi:hypothetical protein